MEIDSLAYLAKAAESLAGAESEFTNRRYDNCASRCYYAMFQAAIAALIAAGIRPDAGREHWEHSFVQARFAGVLISRRKLYSPALGSSLPEILDIRRGADYGLYTTSRKLALHALEKARLLVSAIETRLR
ncbi:MAG: HEPN domain-containing protein [Chloroflexi bacterium]|nr:HEPN domain-containing protein [Chloroflexota bacterium]